MAANTHVATMPASIAPKVKTAFVGIAHVDGASRRVEINPDGTPTAGLCLGAPTTLCGCPPAIIERRAHFLCHGGRQCLLQLGWHPAPARSDWQRAAAFGRPGTLYGPSHRGRRIPPLCLSLPGARGGWWHVAARAPARSAAASMASLPRCSLPFTVWRRFAGQAMCSKRATAPAKWWPSSRPAFAPRAR